MNNNTRNPIGMEKKNVPRLSKYFRASCGYHAAWAPSHKGLIVRRIFCAYDNIFKFTLDSYHNIIIMTSPFILHARVVIYYVRT